VYRAPGGPRSVAWDGPAFCAGVAVAEQWWKPIHALNLGTTDAAILLAMAMYGYPESAAPVWWIAYKVGVWDRTVQRHLRYLVCRGCDRQRCTHLGLLTIVSQGVFHTPTTYRIELGGDRGPIRD